MKLKGILLVLALGLLLMPGIASALGTNSGSTLTNNVKLFYQNVANEDQTPVTDAVSSTVKAIYGYDSTVPTGNSTSISPGATATFRIRITNRANTSDTFTYSLDAFDTYGTSGFWSCSLYDSSGVNTLTSPHTDGAIAEDAETSIVIKITAPSTAANNDAGTAWVSVRTNNSPAGSYTGNNGTTYGGEDTATFIFVTTVSGPVMSISKTLSVSAPSGYGGGATDPVPGATLNYTIAYQNTGSGTAVSVWIYDTFPTATGGGIGWKYGSVSYSTAPDTIEWYSGSWGTGEPADNGETATVIRFGFATVAPGASDTVGFALYIK